MLQLLLANENVTTLPFMETNSTKDGTFLLQNRVKHLLEIPVSTGEELVKHLVDWYEHNEKGVLGIVEKLRLWV